MKHHFKTPIITLLFLSLISCSGYKSNDTLLQIGDYKLTVADYEYMRNENDKRARLPDADLEKKIINDGYVCAFALDNKYDTIALIKKKMDYANRFYAAVQDGYIWNKKYKPLLTVSEADSKNAYAKKQTEYNLELIYFPDKELLTKYLPSNGQVKTTSDFDALKSKVKSEPKISFSSRYQQYPFTPSGIDNEKVIQSKPGDVWGPVEIENGYVIIHIADSRNANIPPYSAMKERIERELTQQLTQKYVQESQRDILKKTNPVMYDKVINYMLSACNIQAHTWNAVDKSKILMTYHLNGIILSFTIADFIGFIENEPLYFGSLTDVTGIKSLLNNNIIDIYLYDEAVKMNMLTDPVFFAFKKNRQFKLFTQYYKVKNIKPKVVVTEAETRKYYAENIDKFKTPGTANVLIYKFKDNETAMKSARAIMAQNSKKSAVASAGANFQSGSYNIITTGRRPAPARESITLPVPTKTSLKLTDPSCPPNVKAELMRLIPGKVSMPVSVNGEYWLLYLNSKSDLITLPYQEVEKDIKQKLPELLGNKLLESQVTALQSTYQLKINLLNEYLLYKEKNQEAKK